MKYFGKKHTTVPIRLPIDSARKPPLSQCLSGNTPQIPSLRVQCASKYESATTNLPQGDKVQHLPR